MENLKIMIVEDEAIEALYLKTYLKKYGYQVVCSVDRGADALICLKKYHPEVLLTDIFLKDQVTGIDIAREVLKTDNNIKVIYITASTNEEIIHQALKTKPLTMLFKPFDFNKLNTTLEYLRV